TIYGTPVRSAISALSGKTSDGVARAQGSCTVQPRVLPLTAAMRCCSFPHPGEKEKLRGGVRQWGQSAWKQGGNGNGLSHQTFVPPQFLGSCRGWKRRVPLYRQCHGDDRDHVVGAGLRAGRGCGIAEGRRDRKSVV